MSDSTAVAAQLIGCAGVPMGASGVTFVMSSGNYVPCGTDANGATMYEVVNTALVAVPASNSDVPVEGGGALGLVIGGAVFSVLAVAFGFRVLRNFVNSSSEG